ncbi:MAG: YmdB family metallophosphoesterase, partial [Planctomycetota bacterium]
MIDPVCRILCLGDVVGRPGVRGVERHLPEWRARLGADLVVVNAENACDGSGLTVGIMRKLQAAGCRSILLTERGTTFGYHNLVVDMRGIPEMKETGHPVIFDVTHSVQRPAAQGTCSGGDRELAPTLARAAVAAGANGVFIETHPDPDNALCDASTMLPTAEVPRLLERL